MTNDERQAEQEKNQKVCDYNDAQAYLKNTDYRARKVAFEIAAAVKQIIALNGLDIPTPIYDAYISDETNKAQEKRDTINRLRPEIEG